MGNGGAWAIGAVGGIFLWSALFDKKVLTTVQDLVTGNKPLPGKLSPDMFTAALGVGGAAGGGTASTGTATAPAGPGMTANAVAILKTLGAPLTQANISSLVHWQTLEGANSYNNPLNTTLRTSGSVGTFNSVGVQEYATAQDGIAATVATLLSGYGSIVSALRTGGGLSGNIPGVSGELSKWSGGGYSSV